MCVCVCVSVRPSGGEKVEQREEKLESSFYILMNGDEGEGKVPSLVIHEGEALCTYVALLCFIQCVCGQFFFIYSVS